MTIGPATLLMEYVGVVEMRFCVPEPLRQHFFSPRLLHGALLIVRVPTVAWNARQYSRDNVFKALCEEIITATIGVEAASDTLIYMMASKYLLTLLLMAV
jgi:hypothetical protein